MNMGKVQLKDMATVSNVQCTFRFLVKVWLFIYILFNI